MSTVADPARGVKKGSDVKTVSLGDGGESLPVSSLRMTRRLGCSRSARTKNSGELDRMVLCSFFRDPPSWSGTLDGSCSSGALAESPAPWTAVPFDALDRRPPADAGTMVAVTGESAFDELGGS